MSDVCCKHASEFVHWTVSKEAEILIVGNDISVIDTALGTLTLGSMDGIGPSCRGRLVARRSWNNLVLLLTAFGLPENGTETADQSLVPLYGAGC